MTQLTTRERVERILKEAVGSDLSSWEKHEFLPDIMLVRGPLSPKRAKILSNIEKRLFNSQEEE